MVTGLEFRNSSTYLTSSIPTFKFRQNRLMERPTSEVDLRSRIRCTRHEKKKKKKKRVKIRLTSDWSYLRRVELPNLYRRLYFPESKRPTVEEIRCRCDGREAEITSFTFLPLSKTCNSHAQSHSGKSQHAKAFTKAQTLHNYTITQPAYLPFRA